LKVPTLRKIKTLKEYIIKIETSIVELKITLNFKDNPYFFQCFSFIFCQMWERGGDSYPKEHFWKGRLLRLANVGGKVHLWKGAITFG
jgi:hypothetical protein